MPQAPNDARETSGLRQAVLAASTYGSDEVGLICAYLFDAEGQETVALTAEQVQAYFEARTRVAEGDPPLETDATPIDETSSSRYVWLHFNLNHASAVKWMHRHIPLSAEFFEALAEPQPATRIERVDDELVAVINDVRIDFNFEASDIATLWIGVGSKLIVTARTRQLRSVDDLRMAVRRGESPASTSELLEQLLTMQADTLVRVVHDVTRNVDDIEDRLLATRQDPRRAKLGELRRLLVRLQRLLAPEPAALLRLLQRPPRWMAAHDVQGLTSASEAFAVVLRDMQSLQERIKLLQEEFAAQVNEQNNRSLFTLTIVTVLALPINLVAGLFGMNVGGIPLANRADGFLIVVVCITIVTALAAWVAFRIRR